MSSPSEHSKAECTHNGSTNNTEDTVKWLPKEKNDIIATYLNNWFWFSDDSNICCNTVPKSKRSGTTRQWNKMWNTWTVFIVSVTYLCTLETYIGRITAAWIGQSKQNQVNSYSFQQQSVQFCCCCKTGISFKTGMHLTEKNPYI